jgi:peptide-methionine (R)-S-oxide reductase
MKKHFLILVLGSVFFLTGCAQTSKPSNPKNMDSISAGNADLPIGDTTQVIKTEEEWKKILPAEVYQVSRLKGTERAWTSKYESFSEVGTYYCVACGNALFQSDTKFESGCGWPSFYKPISKTSIIYAPDGTHGMQRTEVMCGKCKGHLGHVFDDGPPPTGLRYCINGVILDFKKAQEAAEKYKKDNKTGN